MSETENTLPATQSSNAAYVARYDVDPYPSFANESGPGIIGKRLSCIKGEWVCGPDKTPVAVGTQYLAIVPTALRGHIRFGANGIDAADVGLVKDNFLMKHRQALGDTDETLWATDPAGNRKDPWAKYFAVQLIEVSAPHSDVTFTSNAWGGQVALQDLCGVYGRERGNYPEQFPVVALAVKPRQTKHGKVPGPWFDFKGWATVEDIRNGRKAAAAPKPKPKKTPPAAVVADTVDDEAPSWR
jgi:hypothetical protein